MAPKKTLYVPDTDEAVWKRAEELYPGSLSQLVNDLLRKEVAKMEAMSDNSKEIERIVIEVATANESNHYTGKRNVAFDGKWLVEDPFGFSIAQTKRGNLLVYYANIEYGGSYHVFDDFEDLESYDPDFDEENIGLPEIPGGVKDTVAKALGMKYEEYLDI